MWSEWLRWENECNVTLGVVRCIGFCVFSLGLMLPCQCKSQCYELTFPLSVLMTSRCEQRTVLIAISNSNKCSKLKQAIEAIPTSIESSLPIRKKRKAIKCTNIFVHWKWIWSVQSEIFPQMNLAKWAYLIWGKPGDITQCAARDALSPWKVRGARGASPGTRGSHP